ncbi:MAG: hypothetical protein WC917_00080 [Bacilli bacterium]|jgi:uncharacterized membrane protein YgcG
MNTFKINEDNSTLPAIELGDKVQLTNQTQEVVECIESKVKMLNIDADELKPGDLKFIKSLGLTISNPETEKAVALGVEYRTFGRKLADFFESDNEDDDDSSFFSPTPSSGGSLFGGSSGFGGFGGGFGGFGGGSFSGGGMSRGF